MNNIQDNSKQKKIRVDLGNEESLNLEREAGSGIWHVVISHEEAEKKSEKKPLDLHAEKRSLERELDIEQFKTV
ncbi:MAG: hypothetical protein KDA65_08360 [Planctomycetaceae bacterium]|nr:hypothetical protein [Planctomycetaceae bacterium]